MIKDAKLRSLASDLSVAVELLARNGLTHPGVDTVADRLAIIQPQVEATMRGQQLPSHETKLRRNVASHARVQHMPVSRMSGKELRAAQRGKVTAPTTCTEVYDMDAGTDDAELADALI